MKRNPGELYENYRERRQKVLSETETYLKGNVTKPMIAKSKLKKRFNKIANAYDCAGQAQRPRLFKLAQRLEKLIEEKRNEESRANRR